ncbi:FtsX-like permease family protein [uncultured Modestobacter sp.]|uniref:FtsX-like permease family protein n=1 Tax=uncultured Modestobacter sp. TaxID=380048 RepID=UPI0026058A7A|nr:FtsX-like permease family protein [uncultured Modestobacter sp.]
MSGWLVRWRLALRIARRDALRARGRSVLVLLMVGLPVLAIVGADTLYRTAEVSAVEQLPTTLGAADARIEGASRQQVWADPRDGELLSYEPGADDAPWTAAEVRDLLPAGAEVTEVRIGPLAYRTDAGYATVDGYADDLTDPLREGAAEVADGRVPVAEGEVAISRSVARAGIAVGDELLLSRDDVPATVVGVLASRPGGEPFLVVPPADAELLSRSAAEFYAAVPGGLGWPAVQELNAQGLVVVSRQVVADPPAEAAFNPPGWSESRGLGTAEVAVLALIVTGLLLEVVLLAGPAFAVGLRQQRRDLAVLAAAGGGPGDLRRVVLASGVVLGGGAAVLGALLGVGLAALAVPVVESRSDVVFGPFDVPLLDVLVVVVVGTLAGLAAAAVPARQAAQTDVVTTLTGRRGQVHSSGKLPVLGLAVAAAGVVLTVTGARGDQGTEFAIAVGAVLLVLGTVLAVPWLVGLLAPLAGRLPTPLRLAVRDATRNRTRTAPAVAAVMATVAGITVLGIANNSDSAQGERDYAPRAPLGAAAVQLYPPSGDVDWADVERVVADQLPDREVSAVRTANWTEGSQQQLFASRPGCTAAPAECRWFPEGIGGFAPVLGGAEVVVVDADALAAVTARELRAEVLAAFTAGQAVVFGSGAVDDGQVTLHGSEWTGSTDRPLGSAELPATEIGVSATDDVLRVPALVAVPPELAERLPVPVVTAELVVGGPDAPVTEAEEAHLREALTALSAGTSVYVERGFTDHLAIGRVLLLVVGGALVLVATLTATGLALADARPDLATLAAVGAAPRTRRLVAMGSAAVIGGTGALLGVLVGFGPGIAIAHPLTSTDYGMGARPLIDVPWLLIGAVAVVVPLLAVAGTGLFVRSRLPMVGRLR